MQTWQSGIIHLTSAVDAETANQITNVVLHTAIVASAIYCRHPAIYVIYTLEHTLLLCNIFTNKNTESAYHRTMRILYNPPHLHLQLCFDNNVSTNYIFFDLIKFE